MDREYDVIVVGAGPAGSSAARKAAESGAHVLLVEEHREVGVPVQCGEYLLTLEEFAGIFPKSKRVKNVLEVPSSIVVNRCDTMRLLTPSGKGYDFNMEGMVVDRRRYDKELAVAAARAGAEIRTACKALTISKKGEVTLQDHGKKVRVKCGVVIGADGIRSTVARSVGLPMTTDPWDQSPTIQFEMTGIDVEPDVVEVYLNQKYSPGAFAWIIPKGSDTANVGLGIRTPFRKGRVNARDCLLGFIKEYPPTSAKLSGGNTLFETGGLVPVGGPVSKTFTENALIVGDAAGFVAASTGAGIPQAVIGGDIAGEVAARRVSGECELDLYERTWKKEMGGALAASLEVRKMIEAAALRGPEAIEKFMELGERFIPDLLRCKIPLSVKLMRRLLRV